MRIAPAFACALAALAPPAPAYAAERRYSVTSFDRIRIDGPFEVRVQTGRPPSAQAEGDAAALDALTLTVEGQTLIVRRKQGASGARDPAPLRLLSITLGTPVLRGVNLNAGGRLSVDRMVAQRIDLSINGAGLLGVAAIDADQLNATVTGAGTMTLAGKAGRARYLITGPGSYEATGLIANDLFVTAAGTGDVRVAARYTADIVSSGLGGVTVAGTPACRVRATGGGAVVCTPKR